MTSIATLPDCIVAMRIGVHDSEFDEFGEAAPITWLCSCGARLRLEHYVERWGEDIWSPFPEFEGYEPVSNERKADFLAKHSDCPVETYEWENTADAPLMVNGFPIEREEWEG